MPSALTYPGVYVEEIPSGVRTITGVATSVAAFVGRAKSGPTNEPITINNFGDYERIFGGLSIDSSLSYAVRDFYLNGGAQAIIVRLFHADATAAKATIDADTLGLEAASEGAWANKLRARVDHDVVGPDAANLFNLSIRHDQTAELEVFRNVSVVSTSPRRDDKVLENEPRFVRVTSCLPGTRPAASGNTVDAGKTVWDDNATATNSKVAAADIASDGLALVVNDFTGPGLFDQKKGLYALRKADLFNLLCIPSYLATGDVDTALITEAAVYCEQRRAMLLVDPPSTWTTKDQAKNNIGSLGTTSKNAALFFPR